jgi:hypothetical protein
MNKIRHPQQAAIDVNCIPNNHEKELFDKALILLLQIKSKKQAASLLVKTIKFLEMCMAYKVR